MKSLYTLIFTGIAMASSLKNMTLQTNKGKKISLKNKTVLIVNIATRCGYTPQLDELEKLNQKYKDKGLIVVGVPSNDFGKQTPENDAEVEKFCRLNYGVSFDLLKKQSVQGKDKTDLFKYLIEKTTNEEISWNFEKFLIAKTGEITRYSSSVSPLNSKLETKIKELL